MEYRPYGRTGEQVSILAFGGMRFEAPLEVERMAETAVWMYEHGVNYFDTAPGYCQDKSEEIIGAAVREMKRRRGPRFYVATKTFSAGEADVRQAVEKSLKRLGVESIDFYHAWCIRSWPEWEKRRQDGVLDVFRKLKDEGLVRHLCASIHLGAADARRLAEETAGVLDGLLLGYSAANFNYREDGLRAAHQAGLGVMVMNPLGGGVFWQAPEMFEFLKSAPGDDLLRGGLRFVLSNPAVTGAVVGVRNMADARAAVAAVESLKLFSPPELAAAKERAVKGLEALCTGCGYCSDCPEGLPLPRLMDAFNHIVMHAEAQVWGRLKYGWGIEAVDEVVARCSECGQCEEACTQRLPVRERLKKLAPVWKKADDEAKAKAKEKK